MNVRIEPDPEPRDTRFHRRIISSKPIPNTRSGHTLDLECGHQVMTFGNLDHAQGRVLCTTCRDGVTFVNQLDIVCTYCLEPFAPGEPLFPMNGGALHAHRECLIRLVAGSAAHQLHECSCYGGTREDPPGPSLRDAARLALETFRILNPDL